MHIFSMYTLFATIEIIALGFWNDEAAINNYFDDTTCSTFSFNSSFTPSLVSVAFSFLRRRHIRE